MQTLLSVVVPIYNEAIYLSNCIDSILAQSYKNLEIIMVDDGSTDESGKICNQYCEKNENCMVVHVPNGGIAKARFIGAKMAKGEWITFVDADDWIDEEYYEKALANVECDVIITGEKVVFPNGKIAIRKFYLDDGIYDKEKIERMVIPQMMYDFRYGEWLLEPSLCTKIFRRELILQELYKTGDLGVNQGEDSIVLYPLMLKVNSLLVMSNAFYNYRQRKRDALPDYIKDDQAYYYKLMKVYDYLMKEFQLSDFMEVLRPQLDIWFAENVWHKRRAYMDSRSLQFSHQFGILFPFDKIEKGSKIILYGAGKVGITYINQIKKYNFCDVVLWADKNENLEFVENNRIETPPRIKEIKFDYIVIAVDNPYVAMEIKNMLLDMKIEESKIVWHSIRRCSWHIRKTIAEQVKEE